MTDTDSDTSDTSCLNQAHTEGRIAPGFLKSLSCGYMYECIVGVVHLVDIKLGDLATRTD